MTTFAGLYSAQQAFAYVPQSKTGVIIANGKAALGPKNRDVIDIVLLSARRLSQPMGTTSGRTQEDV
jgi:hypothetical protein